MELFDIPISESAKKLISENTKIVNENISRWVLSEKNIQSGISQKILDMLTFAKRRNNIGQKRLKMTVERNKTIEELVRRGHKTSAFKGVIDFKIKEWSGTDFEKNLTPETLFNKKKFQKYLEEAREEYLKSKPKQESKEPKSNQYEDMLK